MEYFIYDGMIGLCIGVLIGIGILIGLAIFQEPKVQKSGSYLTYENVIYKQVKQEELDNIIVLEVKWWE